MCLGERFAEKIFGCVRPGRVRKALRRECIKVWGRTCPCPCRVIILFVNYEVNSSGMGRGVLGNGAAGCFIKKVVKIKERCEMLSCMARFI